MRHWGPPIKGPRLRGAGGGRRLLKIKSWAVINVGSYLDIVDLFVQELYVNNKTYPQPFRPGLETASQR